MPEISIIIPFYNVEAFMDRCLETIVDQTIGIHNLQIICVDDCSTDHTWEKLLEWEKRFPDEFLLIKSERNGRQGTARNIGLGYATAPWIAFLDSDDWIELDYLEKMYRIAKDSEYDLICCGNERDPSKGKTFFENNSERKKEDKNYRIDTVEKRKGFVHLQCLTYSCWAKLIRKDFLVTNNIFFPENMTYEDCFWGSLVIMHANRVYELDEKLYHYYVNDGSTVLKKNADHHLDCITVQQMTWNEWQKRGFMELYQEELEFEYMFFGYIAILKALIFRFEEPSYSLYLLTMQLFVEKIRNYRENKYVRLGELEEKFRLIMQTSERSLSRLEFREFVKLVRKIGL